MTETRIRWQEAEHGNLAGYAGILENRLFKIQRPVLAGERWVLTTTLPDWLNEVIPGTPDQLKAEAERWLEEFVSSLGASFGAEPDYSAVTRFETIDHTRGLASISPDSVRAVVVYGARVEFLLQDDGRTLKVILTDPAKETPAEPVPPRPEEETA